MRISVVLLIVWVMILGSVGCSSSGTAVNSTPIAREISALNWGSPVIVDNGKFPGNVDRFNLAIVSGNPAVAYIMWDSKTSRYTLYYKRASNTTGTSWNGSAKTVAVMPSTAGGINTYCSLAIVNGNPAIGFIGMTNHDLRFVRATDAVGSSWGQPVVVTSQNNAFSSVNMQVVNGNPAFVYNRMVAGVSQFTTYVRATDPNGTAWGPLVVPDPTTVADHVTRSFAIVNGHPAISYYGQAPTDFRFIRAADPSGDIWGAPQILRVPGPGAQGRLGMVNGFPAIVFSQNSQNALSYMRALDADGTAWPATEVSVGSGTSGYLSVINGVPSIVCSSGGSAPFTARVYQALDNDGASWGSAQTVAQLGNVDAHAALLEVAGGAGIAYQSATKAMSFIRGQ